MQRFDKIKYQKLVEWLRSNVGSIWSLNEVKPGVMVNFKGKRYALKQFPGLKDKEALVFHLKHYISNYKIYPDEPMVTFSEDYTKFRIEPSYNELKTIKRFTNYRGRFYDVKNKE